MMNYQLARANMVTQQVRAVHVYNEKILTILGQLPRENFVLKEYVELAYCDEALPIGEGQMALAPSTVGRILQSLNLSGHEKVLEIGTGTGFITACLSKLCKEVVSIEIFPTLLEKAQKELERLNCHNFTLEQGNGVYGLSHFAPFDAILVTGSYPCGAPEALFEQLNPKGRLIAFTGSAPMTEAVLIQKEGKSNLIFTKLFETYADALIDAPLPSQFKF